MSRVNSYIDPDYDRRLEEYKALKAKMKQQGDPDQFSQNQTQAQNNFQNNNSQNQTQNQHNSENTQRPSSNQIRRY